MYDHLNSIMNKDRLQLEFEARKNYEDYRRASIISSVSFNDLNTHMNYGKYPASNKNNFVQKYNNEKVNMLSFNRVESRHSPSNYSNYSTLGTQGSDLICPMHSKDLNNNHSKNIKNVKPHLNHLIGNNLKINKDDSIFEDTYKIDSKNQSGFYSSRHKNNNHRNTINYYDRNYYQVNDRVENLESTLEVMNSKLDYDILNMKINKMNKLSDNIRRKSDFVQRMKNKTFTSPRLEELEDAQTVYQNLNENSDYMNFQKTEEKNNYYNFQNKFQNDYKNSFAQQKNIEYSTSTPTQRESNNNFSYNINSASYPIFENNAASNLVVQKSQNDFLPSKKFIKTEGDENEKINYEKPIKRKVSLKQKVEDFSIPNSKPSLEIYDEVRDYNQNQDNMKEKINYEEPLKRKVSLKQKVEDFSLTNSKPSLLIIDKQRDYNQNQDNIKENNNYEEPLKRKVSLKEKVEDFCLPNPKPSLLIIDKQIDYNQKQDNIKDKDNYEEPFKRKLSLREKVEDFSIPSSSNSLNNLNTVTKKSDFIQLSEIKEPEELQNKKNSYQIQNPIKAKIEDFSITKSTITISNMKKANNNTFMPQTYKIQNQELVLEKLDYNFPITRKISQNEKVEYFSIQPSCKSNSNKVINPQKVESLNILKLDKNDDVNIKKISNIPQISTIPGISIVSCHKKHSSSTDFEELTGRLINLKKENETPVIDLEKTRRKLNFETDEKIQANDPIELCKFSPNYSTPDEQENYEQQEPEFADLTFDIINDDSNMDQNFCKKNLNPSPKLKKGKHFKRDSISPNDFKKLVKLSDLSNKKKVTFFNPKEDTLEKPRRNTEPHQKLDKSNLKSILKNNFIMPQIDPSDYDLSKQLSHKKPNDKTNISQYDFDNVFDPTEDQEVYKKIAMQKFNYLIQQTEKEELEAKKIAENDQEPRPARLLVNKENKNKSSIKIPSRSPVHRCSHSPDTHRSLCKKFKQNPAKFYTEKPSNLLLKSLDIHLDTVDRRKLKNSKSKNIYSPNNKVNLKCNTKLDKDKSNIDTNNHRIPIIQLQKIPENNINNENEISNISSNDEEKVIKIQIRNPCN